MLILPMLFGAFQPPKSWNRILRWYTLDGHGLLAAENVEVATEHGKMLAVLVLGARGRPCGSTRSGLRWLKSSEQHGRDKHRRGPSIRAIKRCVTR